MRVVLAVHNPNDAPALRRILLGEGLTCDSTDVTVCDQLASRLSAATADLVVVDCSHDDAYSAICTAHQITGAPILACGDVHNADRVRQAIRSGAKEYLDVANFREEFAATLAKLETQGDVTTKRGSIIAIYSPNGGAGVTTTAINLAARLTKNHKDQVALVDMKPAPSDLALMLDLEPKHTTCDVLTNWERLDRKMLRGAMTTHNSGIAVLPQIGYDQHDGSDLGRHIETDAVRQMLVLLRRTYEMSVLDLDTTLCPAQIEAMRLANCVALLARPDVPGIRRARWALEAAAQRGIARSRFRLVLSRAGVGRQITADKCEEILGISVMQTIPEDGAAINRSVNEGVPVCQTSKLSRISRSYSSFAQSVEAMGGSSNE